MTSEILRTRSFVHIFGETASTKSKTGALLVIRSTQMQRDIKWKATSIVAFGKKFVPIVQISPDSSFLLTKAKLNYTNTLLAWKHVWPKTYFR